jgi:photosystem II stability/assembly factor-like uncharacterized protein
MSSADARLYIGTNGLSVWTSDDLGETLVRMQSETGLYSGSQVWALAAESEHAILAGTETGLYRLDPRKGQWRHVASAMDGRLITAIAVAPGNSGVLLAGTQPAGLFRSEDGGTTWHDLGVPMKPYVALRFGTNARGVVEGQRSGEPEIKHWTRVTQIVFDRLEPERVYAGVEVDYVWRSADGGRTWEKSTGGLVSPDIHGFITAGGKRLLATTNAGLHVSNDRGVTWRHQPIDSPWQYVRSIAHPTGRPGILFMTNGDGAPGSQGRLYRSDDAGETWGHVPLPGEVQSSLYFLAFHPSDPKIGFASTSLGQFYRTTDGGETWHALPRRLGEIRALLLSGAPPKHHLA